MTSFGSATRELFQLDFASGAAFLNHGSFGAVPRAVAASRAAQLAHIESAPDEAFRATLRPAWRRACDTLATLAGAEDAATRNGFVFVDCATLGVQVAVESAVRAARKQGAERVVLIDFATTYHSCALMVEQVAAEHDWVEHVRLAQLPLAHSDEECIEQALAAVENALAAGGGVRVVLLVDHVESSTARVNPVLAIGQALRKAGGERAVLVVDGAHAIGQVELVFDAEFADVVGLYVTNLHKWLYAPRGCALLYAHTSLREHVRPLLVSHSHHGEFQDKFMVQATRDDSRWLCIDAVAKFVNETCGGLKRIRDFTHSFAAVNALRLAERWKTRIGADSVDSYGAMALIQLPKLPFVEASSADHQVAFALSSVLHKKFNVIVPIVVHERSIWCRISAQIYSDVSDIEALEKAIDTLMTTTDPKTIDFVPRAEDSETW